MKSCFFFRGLTVTPYTGRGKSSLSLTRDPIIRKLCFTQPSLWELSFNKPFLEGLKHAEEGSIVGIFVQWGGREEGQKEMQRRKRKICLPLHFPKAALLHRKRGYILRKDQRGLPQKALFATRSGRKEWRTHSFPQNNYILIET